MIDNVKLVYTDIAYRISNDNTHSWYAISTAALILTLSGTLLRLTPGLPSMVYLFGIFWLLLSILFGVVSIFAYRELRFFPWLLGKSGREAIANSYQLLQCSSVFHTSDILHRFSKAEGNIEKTKTITADYMKEIDVGIVEEFTTYTVFLAHLIEMKKLPRYFCMLFLVTGICFIFVSFLLTATIPQQAQVPI